MPGRAIICYYFTTWFCYIHEFLISNYLTKESNLSEDNENIIYSNILTSFSDILEITLPSYNFQFNSEHELHFDIIKYNEVFNI